MSEFFRFCQTAHACLKQQNDYNTHDEYLIQWSLTGNVSDCVSENY